MDCEELLEAAEDAETGENTEVLPTILIERWELVAALPIKPIHRECQFQPGACSNQKQKDQPH